MPTFSMIYSLDKLTAAEQKQYLADYSTHLGLDPALNALDVIWMDNDCGIRRLVAYARRGTTDILRGILAVKVTSLTQHDGPGYVSFTASGTLPSGRQEMAVGACATEGLKGDRLAAAVATAQTRALRRLTLQFVGTGLLDESEVTSGTTAAINDTPVFLAPQPTVNPNTVPGKDITEQKVVQGVVNARLDSLTLLTTPAVPVEMVDWTPAPPISGVPQGTSKPVEVPAPFSGGSIIPESTETIQEVAKPRKPRKNKARVSLEPDVTPIADIPESKQAATEPVDPPKTLVPEAGPRIETTVFPGPPLPTVESAKVELATTAVAVPLLTNEEMTAVKKRLSPYWVEILPNQGGLSSDSGMGVFAKVKAFAVKTFGKQWNEFTKADFDQFIDRLDAFNAKYGPVELAKFIDKTTMVTV